MLKCLGSWPPSAALYKRLLKPTINDSTVLFKQVSYSLCFNVNYNRGDIIKISTRDDQRIIVFLKSLFTWGDPREI
jgi:hypothetical protein